MFFQRLVCLGTVVIFFVSLIIMPLQGLYAQSDLGLPVPGSMVSVSPSFQPPLIRGLTIHQDNPFLFDFIVDPGQDYRGVIASAAKQSLKDQADRMIKYFFAALTIPDKDIWVNLSPYEKDRMIPMALAQTAMGRDLLAQDYMLKQLTASLIYPQKALGKTFWEEIYKKAKEMYGTTQVPVNTFNKVWIVPQKAGIYEHGQTAFIVSGHLKVMLEQDYLAFKNHQSQPGDMSRRDVSPSTLPSEVALNVKATQRSSVNAIGSCFIRTIILPEIEKEINEDKNFSTLRQIFYAQVLAVWFKRNLKQALLNRVYVNKNTVKGIEQNNTAANGAIYYQYLQAYKKGVFNFIKDEIDPMTQESMPRKYFSGGFGDLAQLSIDHAQLSHQAIAGAGKFFDVSVLAVSAKDAAMLTRRQALALGGGLIATLSNPFSSIGLASPASVHRRALYYPDGSVMLGENEPGIAYYPQQKGYRELLDEREGGLGDARLIAQAGFKVIRIYMESLREIEDLENITKKIYEQHGIKTEVVLSSFIFRYVDQKKQSFMIEGSFKRFMDHLGQHPWILIQIGNEDNYYLQGGPLAQAQRNDFLSMDEQRYYSDYDKLIGAFKKYLPAGQPPKPILFGVGINFQGEGWKVRLERTIHFINQMQNVDAVSINAYLYPSQAYGVLAKYLSDKLNKPIVFGEFGWSLHHSNQQAQHEYNQLAWNILRQAMRDGQVAGGFVFAFKNKPAGVFAEGLSEGFIPYDQKFGIYPSMASLSKGQTYYSYSPHVPVPVDLFADDEGSFWQATEHPSLNREYFLSYISKHTPNALGEAEGKRRLQTPLKDDVINGFSSLNYTAMAYYFLGLKALYDKNWDDLRVFYAALSTYFYLAEIQYSAGSFWNPFEELKKQMELYVLAYADKNVSKIIKNPQVTLRQGNFWLQGKGGFYIDGRWQAKAVYVDLSDPLKLNDGDVIKIRFVAQGIKKIAIQFVSESGHVQTFIRSQKPEENGKIVLWDLRGHAEKITRIAFQVGHLNDTEDMGGFSNGDVRILSIEKQDRAMFSLRKQAAFAVINGGIDLSQQASALRIEKDANGGVKVNVDPAMIARVERKGMSEVVPVIINMRPADIQSLLG